MKQSFDRSPSVRPAKIPSINISKEVGRDAWEVLSGSDVYCASSDASLFSSSLPVLPHKKLNLNVSENSCQFVNGISSNDSLEDVDTHRIGTMLPDDEELLASIMDDFDLSGLPSSLEDLEDYDLFGSSGGMELETDPQESLSIGISKLSFSDSTSVNGLPHYSIPNAVGTVAGEHPYGEHPSRTLFVRNINSNVEDNELRALFEQYGDIRTLYTACKHRGFVMISYYDIRAARTAMRALQNKPLRRRRLDIHFSIPKDNPSDKDINQGTLVAFNLDPSVSNEDLRQIFGVYGEVKEIRETPHKRHHKFIEFFDARAAEAALKSLNRSDIAGKRIKLEPSRPGGARRNLMLQLNQDLELDESQSFRHQVSSPVTNSPPGDWLQFNSTIEHNLIKTIIKSPASRILSPTIGNRSPGLASILQPQVSNTLKGATVCQDLGSNHEEHIFTSTNSSHGAIYHSNSLPAPTFSQYHGTLSSFSPPTSNGSSMETLSGPQFLWGSSSLYSEHTKPSARPRLPVRHPFTSSGKGHAFPFSGQNSSFAGESQHHHHHHVGSAPLGIPFKRHFGFLPESPDTSLMNHVGYGGIGSGHNDGNFMANVGGSVNAGITIPRNITGNGSSNFRMRSSPRLSPVFLSKGPYPGLPRTAVEGLTDRGRSRRVDNNGSQVDNKKQFQLDLDKIKSGEDTRTTLMIKNIPNKYTSKMLLASIDEKHGGTYDFLYLPIDFKNKCNVGYAFINILLPSLIIPFYETFNGKKWEKFNSEKVASLAYARIQGKASLVSHFQNSSLMNDDNRCRPILFHSEGPEPGDQITHECLPSDNLNALRPK